MFWHSYPKQHYNNRSVIELTHNRYYVELQEEHSQLIRLIDPIPEEIFFRYSVDYDYSMLDFHQLIHQETW